MINILSNRVDNLLNPKHRAIFKTFQKYSNKKLACDQFQQFLSKLPFQQVFGWSLEI